MVHFQFAGTLVVALKTSAWSKPSLGSLLGLSTQEEGQGKKNMRFPFPTGAQRWLRRLLAEHGFPPGLHQRKKFS